MKVVVGKASSLLLALLQLSLILPFVAAGPPHHNDRDRRGGGKKNQCKPHKPHPYPKPHPHPKPPPKKMCEDPLKLLVNVFGKNSDVVIKPGSSEYTAELKEFWNAELQETKPKVIVRPTCADDASKIIKVLSANKCKFSIRGGGHSTNRGAANSDNVLITTSALDKLSWKTTVGDYILSVGPGARWGEVYGFAEKKGRTCVGGRYAAVGVGGYLLGGGLSHYSYKYGFGADMIQNMEVVLANGDVVNVNANSRADLFWALKGGHNNFGFVTRFDLKTIPHSKVYGGLLTVSPEHYQKVMDALYEWQTDCQPKDDKASVEISLMRGPLVQSNDWTVTSVIMFYGDNVDRPDCFKPFYDIPVLASTLRLATHKELTEELAAANNNDKRHLFYTGGYELKKGLNEASHDIYMDVLGASPLYSDPTAYTAYTIQTISGKLLAQAGQGNAIGVSASDAPYVWYSIHMEYTNPALDAQVYDIAREAHKKIQKEVKKKNAVTDFIYINDAGEDQKAILTYEGDSVKKMRQVCKKYDPEEVFQKLCSGPFKLK